MGTVYLESTEVSDIRTLGEIQELLSRKGARSINVAYENGRVISVDFAFTVGEQIIPFRLPCRFAAVEKILRHCNKKLKRNDTYADWARRVAWRQILYWLKAQLALIETDMVRTEEVFLPYAIVATSEGQKSVYEFMIEKHFLALPAPKDTTPENP